MSSAGKKKSANNRAFFILYDGHNYIIQSKLDNRYFTSQDKKLDL